jgi:polynucleotide 5'-kinase involved in rRNA processing
MCDGTSAVSESRHRIPGAHLVNRLNLACKIAQLDQRIALPDQCLHSAEADVRPSKEMRRDGAQDVGRLTPVAWAARVSSQCRTMFTISLVGQKGGTGKTTISVGLACAAARAGRTVAIIDLDPQATALKWKDRRSEKNPSWSLRRPAV